MLRNPSPIGPQAVLLLGFLAVAAIAAAAAGERVGGLLSATAGVALPAAILSMLLATPAAVLVAKGTPRWRTPTLVAMVGLLLLPPHVIAAGWTAAATQSDWMFTPATIDTPSWFLFSGWRGAVLLHAMAGAPWAVVLSSIALVGVDRRREEQALLEASPARVFARVTAPAAAAGLAAATVLVAVLAAAEIAITDLMRVRTFAEEVYLQASLGAFEGAHAWREAGGWRMLAGAVVLACVAAAGLRVLARAARAAISETSDGHAGSRYLSGRRLLTLAGLAVVVGLVVTPVSALFAQVGRTTVSVDDGVERIWSFASAAAEVAQAPWLHRRELLASASLAVSTATAVVLLATVGVWFGRNHRFGRSLLLTMTAAGLAIPGPLLAIAAVQTVNQPADSWLAPLGWLYGGWLLPWLVQVARLLPIGVVLLSQIAVTTPTAVVAAARLDGAGPWGVLLRVVAPLHAGKLLACWLVAFALAFGELSATALVVPPGDPPIAVRLLSLLHYGVEERVAALSLWFFAAGVGIATLVLTAVRPTSDRNTNRAESLR